MRSKLTLFVLVFGLLPGWAVAQTGTVEGTVVDAAGEGLPGVNVVLDGTTVGAATDADGSFRFEAPEGEHLLVASAIGFARRTQPVTVRAGQTVTVSLRMQEDFIGLDEVIVVGYGNRERRDVTGAVSSVTAEQLENVPFTSTEEILQGKTAGVQVTPASGLPGGSITVRVRGAASIEGGNQPLYVIDGMPVIAGSSADYFGQNNNALSDINPEDIASIEVLKDASATAIYGSRAANGVVLITTKKGKVQDRTTIDVGYYRGAVSPTSTWDVLNGRQWAEVYREAFDNYAREFGYDDMVGFIETAFGYPAVPDAATAPNYDYVGPVFRDGTVQQFDLSARGGDVRTRYYLSGNFYQNEGYVLGNDYRRISGRLNLEHDPSAILRVGTNIGITRVLNDRASSDNNVSGILTSAALRPPISPIKDEEGNWIWQNDWNIAENVIASAHENKAKAYNWRTLGNAYVELTPLKGLTLRLNGGMDLLFMDEYYRYVQASVDGRPNGFGSQAYHDEQRYLVDATANYVTSIGERTRVNLLGGVSYETNARKNVYAEAYNFPTDQFPNVASGAEPVTTYSGVDRKWGLESYFGRASFTYDDRYIVELSGRLDGSSRFGENNRYGFFPAGSVAWRISEEPFFKTDFFDELKLRASYGITGNDQIGYFESLALYSGGEDYAGQPGLAQSQLASPDLRWESVALLDIGLDVGFWNRRVFLTADYYNKKTNDLILPVPVPWTSGFGSVTMNFGEMQNRGFELALETQNLTGDFQWRTNFNIAFNQNEVKTLVGGTPINAGVQRTQEGQPLGSFYLIRWHGVDPETGMPQWLDKDGNVTSNPTADDRVFVGQVDPKWMGGFTNTFSYKGVDLSVFLQFAGGNHLYNDTYNFMMSPVTFNLHKDYLTRWQQPGDVTDVPKNVFADPYDFTQASTRWLEPADYLRVKDVTLAYTLPQRFSQRLGARNLRLYVKGSNLFTFHKLTVGDPEASTAVDSETVITGESFFTPPQSRMITGGVNLTF